MIASGTGVGEPQSLTNAPAALAVTRAASSHVQLADILGMLKKLHPASKSRATWIIADEVFGRAARPVRQLRQRHDRDKSAPPNWLDYDAGAGCWRLLGLECCPHDHLPALGTHRRCHAR